MAALIDSSFLIKFVKMRIYLDNCCFNRPFDDQSSIRVKLETDAKLYVQQGIKGKEFDLVWSYILDIENRENPFPERRDIIGKWRDLAVQDIDANSRILSKAKELVINGLHSKDALHIACAIEADCSYFLTTDDRILKKMSSKAEIRVVTPIAFIEEIENHDTDN